MATDLPKTMRAVRTYRYGGIDELCLDVVALPRLQDEQVLVKVSAASLNPRDGLLLRGKYPFKRFAGPFPRSLGSDFSGTIVQTGKKTSRFKIGDQVFGLQPARGLFGAFADYYAVSERTLAHRPPNVSHSDVAGLPIAALTSLQALREQANLQAGQHILINGASGGVGTYAIQIAKNMGAYVTAVCGPNNAELCRSLGADDVLDYNQANFEDHQSAYDVVYDVIGRSSPERCSQCLKPNGTYISTIPRWPVLKAVIKQRLLRLLPFGSRQKAFIIIVRPDADDLQTLAGMMADARLKTVVDSRHSLGKIADAFERSMSWRAKGKIIIDIHS